jgi:dTMP kinase
MRRADIRKVEYPNYASESSALVKMYLRGDFGTDPDAVSPYVSATFFAADRYATYKTGLEEYYRNGGIILSDRYTTSNMMHQASKIIGAREKEKFLDCLWDFEYNIYQIPVTDKVFLLDIDPDISYKLIAGRDNKFSHQKEKDIHERNGGYLKRCYAEALALAEKYGWIRVDCVSNGRLLDVRAIHARLYESISEYI